MELKKLFAIRDTSTGKVLNEFFSNKKEAKKRRDELNGGPPERSKERIQFTVTPGPDHRKNQ